MTDRPVLGIWGYSSDVPDVAHHDSGAAIVAGGRVLAAVNEERITRRKNEGRWPVESIRTVLELANLDPDEIETVALAGLKPLPRAALMIRELAGLARDTGILLPNRWFYALLTAKKLQRQGPHGIPAPVVFAAHHDAHAASAYFTGPFERCAVVTLDGIGDSAHCGAVYRAENGTLTRIRTFTGYASPGILAVFVFGILNRRGPGLCGVVGLRPTPGLVPIHSPNKPFDALAVAGPMARDVEDCALFLAAIAGPSPLDPRGFSVAGRDFVAAANAPLAGLRIAYVSDIAKIGVESEIDTICRAATYQLGTWGATVEEIGLDLSFAREAFLQLRGQWMVQSHLERLHLVDRFNPNLSGNIRRGLAQGPIDIAAGEHARAALVQRWAAIFETYDAVCCPCAPVSPFPVEQNYPETIDGKKMSSYIDWVAPTFLVTMAALPAISVPCGLTAAKLPVGLQIVAPRHGEETTLAAARGVERMRPIGVAPSHGG